MSIINRCFLYIDDYPRQSSDVPFDISIDWGDGTVERYDRLMVDRVPPFEHTYNDDLSHNIEVTITNSCGEVVKLIRHVQYSPPVCECENEIIEQSVQEVEVSSCFTDISYDQGITRAKLVVDAVSEIPIVIEGNKYDELPDDVFHLVEYAGEDIVENLQVHVMSFLEAGNVPIIPPLTDIALDVNGGYEHNGAVYRVSSSNSDSNAWRAFDGLPKSPTTASMPDDFAWSHSDTKVDEAYGSLSIDIGREKTVKRYSVQCIMAVGRYSRTPTSWEVYGSNDAENWVLLDSQFSVIAPGDWERTSIESGVYSYFRRIDIDPSRRQAYRHYRIVILGIASGISSYGYGPNISELQLYDDTATLIKGSAVEFAYSFRPSYVNRIVLTGDAVLKQRVGNTGFPWVTNEADSDYFDNRIVVGRVTDSIRLGVSAGDEAVYHSIKVYDTQSNIFADDREFSASVYSLYAKEPSSGILKALAGASGTIMYRSDTPHLLGKVVILCDDNARARLQNEGFEWGRDEVDGVSCWRGVTVINKPHHVTEYSFNFLGTTDDGKPIGDGMIYRTEFYSLRQLPSPLAIKFDVPPTTNQQPEIFYYLDDEGKYHCAATCEMEFTAWDMLEFYKNPAFQVNLNLDTEQGTFTGKYYAIGCSIASSLVVFSVGPDSEDIFLITAGLEPKRQESLAVDPEQPEHQYAGWSEIGLWKTADGGRSWARVFDQDTHLQGYCDNSYALGIAPDNRDIVLVGGSFVHDHRGLMVSVNSAVNLFDSIDDAGFSGGALWRTNDGGISWHMPNFSDIAGESVQGDTIIGAAAPINLMWTRLSSGGGCRFRWNSVNGAVSYQVETIHTTQTAWTAQSAVSANAILLYFGVAWNGRDIRVRVRAVFEDDVYSDWAVFEIPVYQYEPLWDNENLWSDTGEQPEIYYDGEQSAGVVDVRAKIIPSDLVFDPHNAGHVYLSTFGMGVFKSIDYGENWDQMTGIGMQTEPDGTREGMVVRRLILGQDEKTLFALMSTMDTSAASSFVAPVYYLDLESGGDEWTELNRPNETNGTMFVDVDRDIEGVMYAVTPARQRKDSDGVLIDEDAECGGCWVSSDFGATWTQIFDDSVTCSVIKIDTRNSSRLYLASLDKVFVSYRGAETTRDDWVEFETVPPHEIRYIFEDPVYTDRILVATDNGTWSVGVPSSEESFENEIDDVVEDLSVVEPVIDEIFDDL